jgi:hypothetical protein
MKAKTRINTQFRVVALFIMIAFTSCIASRSMMAAMYGHFYKYQFAIREHTTRKPSATFTDKIFTVNFTPQYIRVNYSISNNSASAIQIIWDKAYIVIRDDSSKVISSTTLQSSEIGVGQGIEGFITPVDYIKNINGNQTVTEMYPSRDQGNSEQTDWIMGLIGVDIFKLYLPVEQGGQIHIYPFTFYPIEMERSATSLLPEPQQ